MGFPRQEYWSVLPFPPAGDLPDSETEPTSPVVSSAVLPLQLFVFWSLQHRFFQLKIRQKEGEGEKERRKKRIKRERKRIIAARVSTHFLETPKLRMLWYR